MATAPKVGGYNDRQALNAAQQETAAALTLVERATDELQRCREAVGRPDYGQLSRLLGKLALTVSRCRAALGEMAAIRDGTAEENGLAQRVATLEAEVVALREALGR